MSRLVIALLKDESNEIENFVEIDTKWVNEFNKQFEASDIPHKEQVYPEEFVNIVSAYMMNNFTRSETDEQYKLDREPLRNILRRLFGYV